MTNRAVGYTRVSSTSQANPEKSSLSLQAEKIRLQAQIKEYNLLKIYEEPGISGATMDRPALQELMADAEQKKFDAIIVWDISRFGRNLLHLKQNTERLKQLGISFLAVYNGIDTSKKDATGELFLNILAAIYEFELENIKERTTNGRNVVRKERKKFIGKLAYGYRWNDVKKRIETVEDEDNNEAAIVKRIFHEYIYLGKSTPAIAEGLQHDHIPTRSKGIWSDGYIHKILHNPCYRGSYVTNQFITDVGGKVLGDKPEHEWVYYECEALITQEDWERLQVRLQDARAKFAGAPNPERDKYLADGLLRCGLCGATMRLRHSKPNKAGQCRSYYECYWHGKSERSAKIKGKEPCKMEIIPAALMDNYLFQLKLPLQLGLLWEKQYEEHANPSVEPELQRAQQRAENIQSAIKTNRVMIANNDRTQGLENFDPLKYNARNSELSQEGERLRRELAEAQHEVSRHQQLFQNEQAFKRIAADKDTIMELFRQLNALSLGDKRRLLHGLVDGDIEVKPPSPEATLDISEEANALNGWTKIEWKYNPAIIQEVFGVLIPNVDETIGEVTGMKSTLGDLLDCIEQ